MLQSLVLYSSNFDSHYNLLDEFEDRLRERELTHYASALLEKALQDRAELEEALHKAIIALNAARQPANRHFKKIYISYEGEIKEDWLVSDLGLRLIIMHADTANPVMAALQIKILSEKSGSPEVRKSESPKESPEVRKSESPKESPEVRKSESPKESQ